METKTLDSKTNNTPRLCEILGVKVSERFQIDGYLSGCLINSDGRVPYGCEMAIIDAINHPEKIKHLYWTTEDIDGAKAIDRVFSHKIKYLKCGGDHSDRIILYDDDWEERCRLQREVIPTLQTTETVYLNDIILSEKGGGSDEN